MAADAAETPPSLARELASGFIGAGVSVACILPPILHLVTGPLGPLIGGFVAANRVTAHTRARVVVALTIALVLSGFVGTALTVASSLAAPGELPDWFPSSHARIGAIAGVIFAYAGVLAGVGTVLRGAVGQEKKPR